MCVHAVQVCDTLRGALTTFAGTAGFRALLARALVLAKADSTVLASIQVREDGTLAGFDTAVEGKDGDSSQCSCHGGPVLVAHLLDLLTALIGRSLTMRLVGDAWPDAPAGTWISVNEGTDTP